MYMYLKIVSISVLPKDVVENDTSYIVSLEPEGRYHYSTMFRWEPEGRCCCTKYMTIAAFLFSTEHRWPMLTPF